MNIIRKISKLLAIVILILTVIVPVAYAEGGTPSGEIDQVLILKKDGTVVCISLNEYILMYFTRKGALYKFLSKDVGYMYVYGIVSGNKYIEIDNYIKAYFYSKKNVLNIAEAIPAKEIAKFMKVYKVNESTGEVELVPILQNIEELRVIDIR